MSGANPADRCKDCGRPLERPNDPSSDAYYSGMCQICLHGPLPVPVDPEEPVDVLQWVKDRFDEEPEAHIERSGRWIYYVTITAGIAQWGPDGGGWFTLGHKRAVKKAHRKLAAYQRYADREAQIETIRGADRAC